MNFIHRFLDLFSTSGSGVSVHRRRLAHEGGWIQVALMAAGMLASYLGSKKQAADAKKAAAEGTKSSPWEPAQGNLKYGLSEARRLYDQKQYIPPPRRDLSHLFQTVPGMNLLKKSGMAMPNFVTQTYTVPDSLKQYQPQPNGGPSQSIVDQGPYGRPQFSTNPGPIRPGLDHPSRMGLDYGQRFRDGDLNDYLRQQSGFGGIGGQQPWTQYF